MWNENGVKNISIAVNVSARQFDLQLIEQTKNLLTQYPAVAHQLEYEITESIFHHDIAKSALILNQLKQLGIRIALDDFGTGYSSLSYLKDLPIDTLKIDRCFIRDLPDDQAACAIVSAILHMAKGLALEVVAEGVETEPQMRFLKDNGCDIAQGFLFSKPLTVDRFEAFIKRPLLGRVPFDTEFS